MIHIMDRTRSQWQNPSPTSVFRPQILHGTHRPPPDPQLQAAQETNHGESHREFHSAEECGNERRELEGESEGSFGAQADKYSSSGIGEGSGHSGSQNSSATSVPSHDPDDCDELLTPTFTSTGASTSTVSTLAAFSGSSQWTAIQPSPLEEDERDGVDDFDEDERSRLGGGDEEMDGLSSSDEETEGMEVSPLRILSQLEDGPGQGPAAFVAADQCFKCILSGRTSSLAANPEVPLIPRNVHLRGHPENCCLCDLVHSLLSHSARCKRDRVDCSQCCRTHYLIHTHTAICTATIPTSRLPNSSSVSCPPHRLHSAVMVIQTPGGRSIPMGLKNKTKLLSGRSSISQCNLAVCEMVQQRLATQCDPQSLWKHCQNSLKKQLVDGIMSAVGQCEPEVESLPKGGAADFVTPVAASGTAMHHVPAPAEPPEKGAEPPKSGVLRMNVKQQGTGDDTIEPLIGPSVSPVTAAGTVHTGARNRDERRKKRSPSRERRRKDGGKVPNPDNMLQNDLPNLPAVGNLDTSNGNGVNIERTGLIVKGEPRDMRGLIQKYIAVVENAGSDELEEDEEDTPDEGVLLQGKDHKLVALNGHYRRGHEWTRSVPLGNGLTGRSYLAMDNGTDFCFVVKKVYLDRLREEWLSIWSEMDHPSTTRLYGMVFTSTSPRTGGQAGHKTAGSSRSTFRDAGGNSTASDDAPWSEHTPRGSRGEADGCASPVMVGIYQGRLRKRRMVYLLCEYYSGGSLKQLIRSQGALNQWVALYIYQQILHTVAYFQKRGVLHNGIKAESVYMVSGSMRIGIGGFPSCVWDSDSDRGQRIRRYTAGAGLGADPERDCKSDVWAATCVLAHSLGGSYAQAELFGGDMYIPHICHLIESGCPPLDNIPTGLLPLVYDLVMTAWGIGQTRQTTVTELLNHQAFSLLQEPVNQSKFNSHLVAVVKPSSDPVLGQSRTQLPSLACSYMRQELNRALQEFAHTLPKQPPVLSKKDVHAAIEASSSCTRNGSANASNNDSVCEAVIPTVAQPLSATTNAPCIDPKVDDVSLNGGSASNKNSPAVSHGDAPRLRRSKPSLSDLPKSAAIDEGDESESTGDMNKETGFPGIGDNLTQRDEACIARPCLNNSSSQDCLHSQDAAEDTSVHSSDLKHSSNVKMRVKIPELQDGSALQTKVRREHSSPPDVISTRPVMSSRPPYMTSRSNPAPSGRNATLPSAHEDNSGAREGGKPRGKGGSSGYESQFSGSVSKRRHSYHVQGLSEGSNDVFTIEEKSSEESVGSNPVQVSRVTVGDDPGRRSPGGASNHSINPGSNPGEQSEHKPGERNMPEHSDIGISVATPDTGIGIGVATPDTGGLDEREGSRNQRSVNLFFSSELPGNRKAFPKDLQQQPKKRSSSPHLSPHSSPETRRKHQSGSLLVAQDTRGEKQLGEVNGDFPVSSTLAHVASQLRSSPIDGDTDVVSSAEDDMALSLTDIYDPIFDSEGGREPDPLQDVEDYPPLDNVLDSHLKEEPKPDDSVVQVQEDEDDMAYVSRNYLSGPTSGIQQIVIRCWELQKDCVAYKWTKGEVYKNIVDQCSLVIFKNSNLTMFHLVDESGKSVALEDTTDPTVPVYVKKLAELDSYEWRVVAKKDPDTANIETSIEYSGAGLFYDDLQEDN